MKLRRLNAIELATAIDACRRAGAVNASIALSQHIERLECELHQARSGDQTLDLVHANRDAILDMHKEAIRLVRVALEQGFGSVSEAAEMSNKIERILKALNLFHPMHGESWKGWPE